MRSKSVNYVLFGQIAFGIFILFCICLSPHYLFEKNEGGISNFGIHEITVVPYSLAFGLAGVFTLLGAKNIPGKNTRYKQLKLALMTLGITYLIVLLSTYPYKINQAFNDTHQAVSVVNILLEVLLGIWFAVNLIPDKTSYLLLGALVSGFAVATLTRFNIIHDLFIAELLIGLSFGALIVMTIRKIDT